MPMIVSSNSTRPISGFTGKSDSAYIEALAIIEAGRKNLSKTPRADMDGFRACMIDQLRNGKYAIRRQIEFRNREAIRNGIKVYDTSIE